MIPEFADSVNARDKALGRCLLIAGTSVELSGAEEVLNNLAFKARLKRKRIGTVIFDRIRRA